MAINPVANGWPVEIAIPSNTLAPSGRNRIQAKLNIKNDIGAKADHANIGGARLKHF
ncbi:hypothetical protein [Aliihoeflea sp. 40Bstr573]|uniref:hypothetical protein n=1 Tax=Aliihoeflea sp. 40Bstr573 TaxID=2696467 RepID=UPI00209525FE|nr:hypothetical protein [Aliihoeflea sp. 40Bstr573]MCO6388565.1 hypothetical protein [Aliihoeflea sp. 40Bstr573]